MAENTFLSQVKKSTLKFAEKEIKEKDFVVEQGTSDFWTYRKWDSGIAECWGVATATLNTTANSWGSIYYFTPTIYKNFPSGLFINGDIVCHHSLYMGEGVLMSYREGPLNKDRTYGIAAYRPTAGNLSNGNISVILRAIGKWK